MSDMIRLSEIATARAGDKGDTSNIAVFVSRAEYWETVRAGLTPSLLARSFPDLFRGPITRYEIAHLHALNFVLENALEGGVNTSLNLDTHGKSFSYLLLDLDIPLAPLNPENRREP